MSVELQQIVAINLNLDLKTAYEICSYYQNGKIDETQEQSELRSQLFNTFNCYEIMAKAEALPETKFHREIKMNISLKLSGAEADEILAITTEECSLYKDLTYAKEIQAKRN